jgi:hypothetical protein
MFPQVFGPALFYARRAILCCLLKAAIFRQLGTAIDASAAAIFTSFYLLYLVFVFDLSKWSLQIYELFLNPPNNPLFFRKTKKNTLFIHFICAVSDYSLYLQRKPL